MTANRNGNNVSILINNGDGSFASPVNFDTNGNGETAAATSDVNGDGIMDLFIGAFNTDEVILFLGDGDGGFNFSSSANVGTSPWMITSGDVNGDGIPDVVSANATSSNLSVVLCDSLGNLFSSTNYSTGLFPIAITLGDIDGDRDLEVVTSNFSGSDFTLYENDGTGIFINRRNLPADVAGSDAKLHDRDNDGDMDMTGIDEMEDLLILFTNEDAVSVEEENLQPEDFTLRQNYPNPFNPTTKIKFTIPLSVILSEAKKHINVQLLVYDVLGNEIATLVNQELSSGEYEVGFDAGATHPIALTSGIYFYQLRAGESFIKTMKMILLK